MHGTHTPFGTTHNSNARSVTTGWVLVGLFLALPVGSVQADILRTPDGGFTVETREGLPVRGQGQTTVINRFGEPEKRHPTVGEPPITRWDYPDFSVVFEGEYVLHSIVQNKPAPGQP